MTRCRLFCLTLSASAALSLWTGIAAAQAVA